VRKFFLHRAQVFISALPLCVSNVTVKIKTRKGITNFSNHQIFCAKKDIGNEEIFYNALIITMFCRVIFYEKNLHKATKSASSAAIFFEVLLQAFCMAHVA
jgi:hypothetical protein